MHEDDAALPRSWRTIWRRQRGPMGFVTELVCWSFLTQQTLHVIGTLHG